MNKQEKIYCGGMPLAVYREIAAHLRQVRGIRVELLPQTARDFAYDRSQIEAIAIEYPSDFDGDRQKQVEAILTYYVRDRSPWQREINSSAAG